MATCTSSTPRALVVVMYNATNQVVANESGVVWQNVGHPFCRRNKMADCVVPPLLVQIVDVRLRGAKVMLDPFHIQSEGPEVDRQFFSGFIARPSASLWREGVVVQADREVPIGMMLSPPSEGLDQNREVRANGVARNLARDAVAQLKQTCAVEHALA